MNHPKFEVGETVILQSRQMPEHNGEYFVDRVVYDWCYYKDRLTGVEFVTDWKDNRPSYLLSNMAKDPHLGNEVILDETVLRKKHKPAEMSFSALMRSLTSPVGAAWKELDGTTMQRKMSV